MAEACVLNRKHYKLTHDSYDTESQIVSGNSITKNPTLGYVE